MNPVRPAADARTAAVALYGPQEPAKVAGRRPDSLRPAERHPDPAKGHAVDFPHPPNRRTSARAGLTPEQQAIAARLQERAAQLMAGAEDGLSVRDAVDLAAIQLGLDR